ncbi:MAG TPA: tRNA (guanosine(37)-N1)-methyltransferase TrmD [Actinomycetes bacterium]|nr:tRNA (guanosine(37)-N1)-methyltransferase TrmD [Actinomycetes bacterium]
MSPAARLRVDIVTIFPDYLAPLRLSVIGRAIDAGIVALDVHDLRAYTTDRHRTVDDTPYGGGAGMLMRPEPWGAALDSLAGAGAGEGPGPRPVLVVPTPAGEPFTQRLAEQLAGEARLVIACGRYEGIDGRVLVDAAKRYRIRELSIGDYVLAGGEAAALVIVEAVARLLPGVLGNADSLAEESHGGGGLLEGPAFTKPPTWRGLAVPEVLLSGDHARIARWRRDQALRRTASRRPDLVAALDPAALDEADLEALADGGTDGATGGG